VDDLNPVAIFLSGDSVIGFAHLLGRERRRAFKAIKGTIQIMEVNKPEKNQWRPAQIQTILVPTDLRLESMVAFRYALTLAKLFDADLTLLHVFEESYSFDEEIGLGAVELLGVKKSNAEHELSFVEEHLRAQHPKCRSCFRVGTAFEQIVREAESIGADLIVMSSHCYSWLDRILHGSDAERVLRHAPCPVLIVKNENRTRISTASMPAQS
jgi:universal stress protein A